VQPSLRAGAEQHIYALGDCASLTCPSQGLVPPRAQAAHQQALFLAQVLAAPDKEAERAFAYRDYGSLVSLGPLAAIGAVSGALGLGKLPVGGAVARLLYALMYRMHLLALHGFMRMVALTVADWIVNKISPSVRLH